MKKNYLYQKCTIAILMATITGAAAFSQESYYTQKSYKVTIGEDSIGEPISILDQELSAIQLDRLGMSEAGDVIIHNSEIHYISDNSIVASENLHPNEGRILDIQLENSGNAVVYVVDDDKNPRELYVRRREKGADRFSAPVLVRRAEYLPPYGGFYSFMSALDGHIIFWKESVMGTNKVLMTIDTTETGSGEPTLFSKLVEVQERKFLSDDGRTFIFNTRDAGEPWRSYYSFRGDDNTWSEPKQLLIDGEVPQAAVRSMNSTGSMIAMDHQILEWNVNRYEVVREFTSDYAELLDYQITDDGKTLYMTASRKPRPDPRITDPTPRDFDLLQIRWKDDPKNPEVTKIATAHRLTYRLLDNGQRLIYNLFNYTQYWGMSKTDTWEQY